MSHVATIKIEVKDLAVLRAVAEELGLEFREGQRTFKWYGRWMNDYDRDDAAYRSGLDPKDYGKCDHALAVKGKPDAYEVGVIKKPSGAYTLAWDFWAGGHGLMGAIGEKGSKLVQGYAVAVAKKAMLPQGYTVKSSTVSADGTVKVQFAKL